MEVTGPILSERALRYKRNSLVLSVAAILASLVPGALIDQAKVFELTLGPHIWWIGAAILIYNLFWLTVLSRQDFVAWDQSAMECDSRQNYGASFRVPVLGVRISKAFHRDIFWRAITCNAARAKAKRRATYYNVTAINRSAGQYLTYKLFDIGLTAFFASFALIIASGKIWSFFAPVSWGFC
ncbi:MAG: hypothetical protein IID51_04670 [Proteobacteria bacterium]|nr:hypothetical protein [Pseudomonadota bacterium]